MIQASHGKLGNMGLPWSAETLCCLLAILRGTEPVSALTRGFYIAAFSVIPPPQIRQWQSRADRILSLNMKLS